MQAVSRINRISALRFLGWALQRTYIQTLAMSKAAWGWWLRAPPQHVQHLLQTAIQRVAAVWHGGTAVPLRALLRGPQLDIAFTSGLWALSAWLAARAALNNVERGCTGSRWRRRVEAWLATLGGHVLWQGDYCTLHLGQLRWTPEVWLGCQMQVEHELRESWRRS